MAIKPVFESQSIFAEQAGELMPICVLALDRDGYVLYGNHLAAEFLGYNRDTLVGMRISQLDTSFSETRWARFWAYLRGHAEDRLREDGTMQTRDGKKLPVSVTSRICQTHDDEYMLSYWDELAPEVRVGAALDEERRYHAEAQRIAQLGHWRRDLQVDTFSWSDETYRIFGAESKIGMDPEPIFRARVHPDDNSLMQDDFDRAVAERRLFDFEHRLLMEDGSIKWVHERAVTEYDDNGAPTHSLGTVLDITQRKQLEEQLLHVQKLDALGRLVGGISHDFNNVLAALDGNIFLALKRIHDEAYVTKKLNEMKALVTRATEMVSHLLAFARQDSPDLEVLCLSELIEGSLRMSAAIVPANVASIFSVQHPDLHVKGNATQLEQVLMNLLSNALDAVEHTSAPRIVTTLDSYVPDRRFKTRFPDAHADRYACLKVTDNGYGIEPGAIELLFEPFYTTKEVGKGTGLGLASVFGIVSAHGGFVDVHSQPGTETTFAVYLPQATPVSAGEADTSDTARSGAGLRVLLVDDDAGVRMMSREVLQALDFAVIEASDGYQALTIFQQDPDAFDLVMSDVVMPRIGGVELLSAARELKPGQPFLLVTGYDRHNVLAGVEDAANCVVVSKPFDVGELSRTLLALVAASHQ